MDLNFTVFFFCPHWYTCKIWSFHQYFYLYLSCLFPLSTLKFKARITPERKNILVGILLRAGWVTFYTTPVWHWLVSMASGAEEWASPPPLLQCISLVWLTNERLHYSNTKNSIHLLVRIILISSHLAVSYLDNKFSNKKKPKHYYVVGIADRKVGVVLLKKQKH